MVRKGCVGLRLQLSRAICDQRCIGFRCQDGFAAALDVKVFDVRLAGDDLSMRVTFVMARRLILDLLVTLRVLGHAELIEATPQSPALRRTLPRTLRCSGARLSELKALGHFGRVSACHGVTAGRRYSPALAGGALRSASRDVPASRRRPPMRQSRWLVPGVAVLAETEPWASAGAKSRGGIDRPSLKPLSADRAQPFYSLRCRQYEILAEGKPSHAVAI
jgi:hypothetical protein